MLKDIVNNELNRRSAEERRIIHLHQQGKFLRAYEVSCWLFTRFVTDKYKISNRPYKGQKENVPLLGFPPECLAKLLSDEKCRNYRTVKVDDLRVDILLPAEELPDDYPSDLFMEDYNRWKSSLPKDLPAEDEKTALPVQAGRKSATGILQGILAFPVESKSPLECQSFLTKVRQEIASLF